MIPDPIPDPYLWPPTVEFRRDPASVARHFAALCLVAAVEPPEVPRPSRGIVTVGGGRYWPGIVAGVRLLRELGCRLPVEVWYRGSCERTNARDVEGLDVSLVDADFHGRYVGDNRVPTGNEYQGGWEAKLYALTHTPYDQVLFLDADAYCVRDPAPLFDLLSPAEPFLFWSDLPGMDGTVKWPRVYPHGRIEVPPIQGGQLLIDRRHAAKLLSVAHWMNQHSDYYYAWMFGDQDTWRVGLAMGLSGYRCLGPADWQEPAFVCSWKSRPYVVHRCRGKLFRGCEVATNPALPKESDILNHFRAASA